MEDLRVHESAVIKTVAQKILRFGLKGLLACVTLICAVAMVVGVHRLLTKPKPNSAEALLEKADNLAWLNNWVEAAPLYKQAEGMFSQQHKLAQALYTNVSQLVPFVGSSNIPNLIWTLTQDLTKPEAQNLETRLRILTIRGMVEVDYDAATARSTWAMVEDLATRQRHYLLASRAIGVSTR